LVEDDRGDYRRADDGSGLGIRPYLCLYRCFSWWCFDTLLGGFRFYGQL
jgi:hypothetical protein